MWPCQEAILLRRAFHAEFRARFPQQPLPTTFEIYESLDEPNWARPPPPGEDDGDINDEPDPFKPLDEEVGTRRRLSLLHV
jgi:hypothetical protein